MPQFRLALSTRSLQMPLASALKTVAETGVKGIQLDLSHEVPPTELTETGRRQFLHRISELDLTVASTTASLLLPLTEEQELDRRVELLRQAMTFAYSLKATTLCCRVGKVPADRESKTFKLLVEVLSDLCRHGNHVGTVLAITPTDDDAVDLKGLVEQVRSGPIGIDFDPGHFAMTGRATTDALRELHPYISHVQLRDGIREFSGGGAETRVGQGVVDWNELFALLGEMDYRHWMTAIRTQGINPAGDIRQAVAFARNLLPGL